MIVGVLAAADATGAARARDVVAFSAGAAPGTIIVKTSERRLYFVIGDGIALRYPIAVGRAARQWFGRVSITGKHLQPAWSPPHVISPIDGQQVGLPGRASKPRVRAFPGLFTTGAKWFRHRDAYFAVSGTTKQFTCLARRTYRGLARRARAWAAKRIEGQWASEGVSRFRRHRSRRDRGPSTVWYL